MTARRMIVATILGVFALAARADESLLIRSPRPLQAESAVEALEPWETPISGFFVRSHHGVPSTNPSRWVLVIDGAVEKPLKLSLADLRRLQKRSRHAVLQCSGNGRGLQDPPVPGVQWEKGAVGNAEWSGVAAAEVLALASPKAGARFARVEGSDQPALSTIPPFIRSVPLEKVLADALLALEMNREPLRPEHGGPLRLVLPDWYGQNWIKWVTRITLTEEEDAGFYMRKGYRMPRSPVKPGEAWDSATGESIRELRPQTVIVSPKRGETLPEGEVEVRGKAFSAGPVAKVELSLDGGATWTVAQLEEHRRTGGWQSFQQRLAISTGPITVLSRATDAAGRTQPLEADWNPGGYLYNAADRVEFSVGEEALASGASLLRSRCLTCHAFEMIQSQRLALPQWSEVLKKMEGFGARLSAGERDVLLAYLARLSPVRPLEEPRRDAYAALLDSAAPAAGDRNNGLRLFAKNCAVCHGSSGKGDPAPRIAGRALPEPYFRSVVLEGRGEMPGFGALLPSEVASLRAYLSGL